MNSLIIELAKAGIDIPNGKLETLIRSECIPKRNPIKEYFENLPKWDGEKCFYCHKNKLALPPAVAKKTTMKQAHETIKGKIF